MGTNPSTITTRRTVYGNTTTSNPYAVSKTTNKGTTSAFQNGTAFNSIYDFVNKNAESLLNEYLNPNLNSAQNQAKINSFANTQQSRTNLENNIINPLSNRNMLRSSQASDLYKNLANQNTAAVSDFVNNLLASSQSDTGNLLSNLLSYYMLGANYLSDMQNHSLKASSGNATTYTNTNASGNSSREMETMLLKAALMAAGVPV